jgi:hypothetical protein
MPTVTFAQKPIFNPRQYCNELVRQAQDGKATRFEVYRDDRWTEVPASELFSPNLGSIAARACLPAAATPEPVAPRPVPEGPIPLQGLLDSGALPRPLFRMHNPSSYGKTFVYEVNRLAPPGRQQLSDLLEDVAAQAPRDEVNSNGKQHSLHVHYEMASGAAFLGHPQKQPKIVLATDAAGRLAGMALTTVQWLPEGKSLVVHDLASNPSSLFKEPGAPEHAGSAVLQGVDSLRAMLECERIELQSGFHPKVKGFYESHGLQPKPLAPEETDMYECRKGELISQPWKTL